MTRLNAWAPAADMHEITRPVLAENAPVLAGTAKLGFTIRHSPDGG